MLSYIAAVASAVTLAIYSVPVAARQAAPETPRMQVAASQPVASVRIDSGASGSSAFLDGVRPYLLSTVEQKALTRALFRSVRLLDPIR